MHWSHQQVNISGGLVMVKHYQAPLGTTPNTKYNKHNFTTNLIMDKARGYWPTILDQLGINATYLKNKHGPCPVCGGKDRFRFDNKGGSGSFYCNHCGAGYGITLLMLYHGWDFREARNRVAQVLGIAVQDYGAYTNKPIHISHYLSKISQPEQLDSEQKNLDWRRESLISTWQQSKPVTVDDPVDRYLKSRGIGLTQFPSALRHHPHLPYYSDDKKLVGYFPAMLALVTNQNNKGVTLHRTYLENGRKADVPKPKKLMSAIEPRASVGAAIKLFEPFNGKLALAEGIETAFSINIATEIPVWATGSAYGLENIVLPPSISEIIIAVDNDESNRGQEAASILTARLLSEGRKVKRISRQKQNKISTTYCWRATYEHPYNSRTGRSSSS